MKSKVGITAIVVALAAGVFVFIQVTAKVDDAVPLPLNVERQDSVYVLLVGCTEYPHLKEKWRLQGSENDVDLLHETFRDYLGVPEAHITVLKGLDATRDNILTALTRLADTVRKGDRVVFHFSGHGSKQIDTAEDRDELDEYDEILLPADVREYDGDKGAVPNCISDDERMRA